MGGGEMGSWVAPGAWNVPDPDEYVRIQRRSAPPARRAIRAARDERARRGGVRRSPPPGRRGASVRRGRLSKRGTRVAGRAAPVRDHHRAGARARRAAPSIITDTTCSDRSTALDRVFVDDFRLEPIQGYAEEHALTIDLGLTPGDSRVHLLLTGWTDYAFSSDNVAAHQAGLPFRPPWLEIKDASGTWITAMPEIGLPVGRPQTVVVDLLAATSRVGAREVRIETTLRVYWDQILVDTSQPAPFSLETIAAAAATLRWRGFSAESEPRRRGAVRLRLRARVALRAVEAHARPLHARRRRAAAAVRRRRPLRDRRAGRRRSRCRSTPRPYRVRPLAGRRRFSCLPMGSARR